RGPLEERRARHPLLHAQQGRSDAPHLEKPRALPRSQRAHARRRIRFVSRALAAARAEAQNAGMAKIPMYHEGSRGLQDRFGSRNLADRLVEKLARDAFTEEDRAFIEARPMFF